MKKRSAAFVVVLVLALALAVWAQKDRNRILGSWQGDGSLELLGGSPLDGAQTLIFHRDGTGKAVAAGEEAFFTYRLWPEDQPDMLVLEAEDGRSWGCFYQLEKGRLTLEKDGERIVFEKE
ncbi:MAG: hypothetical protein IIV90_00605 [Oscillospiraceae bacterium]|nr:hypothetical protein [Oscillospiraceae bacterium]